MGSLIAALFISNLGFQMSLTNACVIERQVFLFFGKKPTEKVSCVVDYQWDDLYVFVRKNLKTNRRDAIYDYVMYGQNGLVKRLVVENVTSYYEERAIAVRNSGRLRDVLKFIAMSPFDHDDRVRAAILIKDYYPQTSQKVFKDEYAKARASNGVFVQRWHQIVVSMGTSKYLAENGIKVTPEFQTHDEAVSMLTPEQQKTVDDETRDKLEAAVNDYHAYLRKLYDSGKIICLSEEQQREIFRKFYDEEYNKKPVPGQGLFGDGDDASDDDEKKE